MKKLVFLLLIFTNTAFAQVKDGEPVPDLNFQTILNAPVKNIKLSQLQGKIVLIEFWATWCGACLEAMPHLKQLQQKYAGKLNVITVTDETPVRIGQYLAVKPSNLWFAIDTGQAITALFPHHLIPHTVLISADGKLIGNTSPELITDKAMDSLVNKQEVHLAEKKDVTLGYEELIKKYFFAADTVKSRFTMLPEIKGAPGLSKTYLNDSTFNGRRITCLNLELTTLYRLAHGDFPYGRMIDSSGEPKNAPVYCLDLIVSNKTELLPALERELSKRFDLQAKVERQIKDVYVLKVIDADKVKKIPVNTSGKRTYNARHGEIDQQDITMDDFAGYLESYGTSRLSVVNETQITGNFDIKFSFQPENPDSLTKILSVLGLGLSKEKRGIDMLVLYKQKSIKQKLHSEF